MGENQTVHTSLSTMSEESLDTVPLRVVVTTEFRNRLKSHSARIGVSMGEVLEAIADEPLRQLELETLEKAKAASKKAK